MCVRWPSRATVPAQYTQQIVQRATAERDATARRARREPFCPGPNVAFFEIPNELVDAAKCEISSEDPSDQFSFFFNDGNLAVLHLIAEGQGASNPQTLPLGGRDLVADPLGGDLALKLGKGQEHI